MLLNIGKVEAECISNNLCDKRENLSTWLPSCIMIMILTKNCLDTINSLAVGIKQ